MKLFYFMLKETPVLFEDNSKGFSFLLVLISWCFHFFMFSFLQMFLLLTIFVHFIVFSFLCYYRECYEFERAFFTLRWFLSYTPSLQNSLRPAVQAWRLQTSVWDSKHRLGPSVCLNHSVFGNYMINRELYLKFSKYVDKLLVGKS